MNVVWPSGLADNVAKRPISSHQYKAVQTRSGMNVGTVREWPRSLPNPPFFLLRKRGDIATSLEC